MVVAVAVTGFGTSNRFRIRISNSERCSIQYSVEVFLRRSSSISHAQQSAHILVLSERSVLLVRRGLSVLLVDIVIAVNSSRVTIVNYVFFCEKRRNVMHFIVFV